jgi:hypothetical protein
MGVTIMVLEKERLADTVVTNGEGGLNQNDDEGADTKIAKQVAPVSNSTTRPWLTAPPLTEARSSAGHRTE